MRRQITGCGGGGLVALPEGAVSVPGGIIIPSRLVKAPNVLP